MELALPNILAFASVDWSELVSKGLAKVGLSGADPAPSRAATLYAVIERDALHPIFEADSREAYWRLRDELWSQQLHWPKLIVEFLGALRDETPTVVVDASAVQAVRDRFEGAPPRFLSAQARSQIIQGLRYCEAISNRFHEEVASAEQAQGALQRSLEAAPEQFAPDSQEARTARIIASVLLLEIWIAELIRGRRPTCDEVADSIAQNFANVMGGFVGMTTGPEVKP